MRSRLPFLALSVLIPLCGCGVGNVATSTTAAVPSLTGNWQIQSAAASPSLPLSGILLLGALQSQGSTVTGTFRVFYLSGYALCGNSYNTPTAFSGSLDANRNLNLASSDGTIKIQLVVPNTLTSFGTGTIQTFGTTCALAASTPVIGAQFATLSGTYAGPVTASTIITTPPILNGTVTLTLTQSTTPQTDGQFPLTGTLNFTGGGCTSSNPVTGTVSGGEVTLASIPVTPFSLSQERVNAAARPDGSQVMAAEVFYGLGPCSAGIASASDYTGTLTRQ